jgi:hypothetical protein
LTARPVSHPSGGIWNFPLSPRRPERRVGVETGHGLDFRAQPLYPRQRNFKPIRYKGEAAKEQARKAEEATNEAARKAEEARKQADAKKAEETAKEEARKAAQARQQAGLKERRRPRPSRPEDSGHTARPRKAGD